MNENLSIPHINLLYLRSDGERQDLKKADNDNSSRIFDIRFYLEDLRARTQYACIYLDEEISRHQINSEDEVDILFEKNDEGFFSSILVTLHAINFKEALQKAYKLTTGILSTLALSYRRPFRIRSIELNDIKYNLKYSTFFSRLKAKKLILPLHAVPGELPIGSLLAVYREGMNSLDIPYRYTSFFKIYQAWYKGDFAFHETNLSLENKDISRPDMKITDELLLDLCLDEYKGILLNKSFNDKNVFKILNPCRNFLSHYLIDRDKSQKPRFISFNDIDALKQCEALSNLLERMATKILDTELRLLAEYNEKFKELYETHKTILEDGKG